MDPQRLDQWVGNIVNRILQHIDSQPTEEQREAAREEARRKVDEAFGATIGKDLPNYKPLPPRPPVPDVFND